MRKRNMTLAGFCAWARAEKTRWFYGCELWTGAKSGGGYGSARFKGRMRAVHRLIAEHYHGQPPAEQPHNRRCPRAQVNHICGNSACINPAHLYWGTQVDNVRDREAAGTGNHARGEAHPRAKLTDLRVRLARRLVARGAPIAHLARWFGVNETVLGNAVKRRTWRHVQEESHG